MIPYTITISFSCETSLRANGRLVMDHMMQLGISVCWIATENVWIRVLTAWYKVSCHSWSRQWMEIIILFCTAICIAICEAQPHFRQRNDLTCEYKVKQCCTSAHLDLSMHNGMAACADMATIDTHSHTIIIPKSAGSTQEVLTVHNQST